MRRFDFERLIWERRLGVLRAHQLFVGIVHIAYKGDFKLHAGLLVGAGHVLLVFIERDIKRRTPRHG